MVIAGAVMQKSSMKHRQHVNDKGARASEEASHYPKTADAPEAKCIFVHKMHVTKFIASLLPFPSTSSLRKNNTCSEGIKTIQG